MRGWQGGIREIMSDCEDGRQWGEGQRDNERDR